MNTDQTRNGRQSDAKNFFNVQKWNENSRKIIELSKKPLEC